MSRFCLKSLFLYFVLTINLFASANPFYIDFPAKKNLTNEDYIEVQNLIRTVNITPLLQEMYYSENMDQKGYTTFDDFAGRCHKCIHQKLIDPEHKIYPTKKLVKIGRGGDKCFVSCAPVAGRYPFYILSFIQELERLNFNGYFLYYIGGWPNPTGEEIQFAAVPYSFKIFGMKEASLLGFNNVLWIDAACYPLREVDSLFHIIETQEALLHYWYAPSDAWKYIFPQTRQLLLDLSGTDVLNAYYINTIVFGLKMNSPRAKKIVQEYYKYARLGTPFISCFPEEWVLTAIIGNPEFDSWKNQPFLPLVKGSLTKDENTAEQYDLIRGQGFYFYHRKGR